MSEPLPSIQDAKHRLLLGFTHHVLKQSFERNIFTSHIEQALNHDNVAVLPDNTPATNTDLSPSCLVLGWDRTGRALHMVVAYRKMLVVTAYEPMPPKWITPWQKGASDDEPNL